MQFCTNWFENIVPPCRRVVPKYSVLNDGRTSLTKNSVFHDDSKVGLRVNSNGRSWNFLNKLIREFLLSIFRSEAPFGHPVAYRKLFGELFVQNL